MVFHGTRLVFHDFRSVLLVFHGSRLDLREDKIVKTTLERRKRVQYKDRKKYLKDFYHFVGKNAPKPFFGSAFLSFSLPRLFTVKRWAFKKDSDYSLLTNISDTDCSGKVLLLAVEGLTPSLLARVATPALDRLASGGSLSRSKLGTLFLEFELMV